MIDADAENFDVASEDYYNDEDGMYVNTTEWLWVQLNFYLNTNS